MTDLKFAFNFSERRGRQTCGLFYCSLGTASQDEFDDQRVSAASFEDEPFFATLASESPLLGTSWTAEGVAFEEISPARQLDSPLPDHPIRLSFGANESIYGSTGCNNYRSELQELSEDSFRTSRFSTTRKGCGSDALWEQERDYLNFFRDRKFYYKIVGAGEDEELILMDSEPAPEEGLALAFGNNVVARFYIGPMEDNEGQVTATD